MTQALHSDHDLARHLPMLAAQQPSLSRHARDGWKPAEPYPMSERVRAHFRALIGIMLPPPPAPQTPDIIDRVELYVRRFMSHMHPLAARGLWLSIVLLDWSPLFLFRSFRRLHQLERERAGAILCWIGESRNNLLRSLVVGVRALVMSGYFDQDEVHRAIHYAPVPFIKARLSLRQRLLGPVQAMAR
jgi:hypothetical protein